MTLSTEEGNEAVCADLWAGDWINAEKSDERNRLISKTSSNDPEETAHGLRCNNAP